MPQEDVIRFFRKGLSTELQIACQMDHSGRPFQDLDSLLTFAYGLERVMSATASARRLAEASGNHHRFKPQANSAFHPAAPSLFNRKGNGNGNGRFNGNGNSHNSNGNGQGGSNNGRPNNGRQVLPFGSAVQQRNQQRGFNRAGAGPSNAGSAGGAGPSQPHNRQQFTGHKRPPPGADAGGRGGGPRVAYAASQPAKRQPNYSDVFGRSLTPAEFRELTANGPVCLGCHTPGSNRATCLTPACVAKRQGQA